MGVASRTTTTTASTIIRDGGDGAERVTATTAAGRSPTSPDRPASATRAGAPAAHWRLRPRRERDLCRQLRGVRRTHDSQARRRRGCRFMTVDVCGPKGLTANRTSCITTTAAAASRMSHDRRVSKTGYYGFGVLFTDLDDDGWPDIFVANDSTQFPVSTTTATAPFQKWAWCPVSPSRRRPRTGGNGRRCRRLHGDGRPTSSSPIFSRLHHCLRSSAQGVFTDVSYATGVAIGAGRYLGWGVGFVDVDNMACSIVPGERTHLS